MDSLKSAMKLILLVAIVSGLATSDDRPLIGVLMQKCFWSVCPDKAYIAASYVKYLESAGARAVPVFLNRDQSYYEKIVSTTNGLLLPGGGQDLNTSDWFEAAQTIWNLTYGNPNGDHKYPIWGTCLGFETLAALVGQPLTACSASDVANTLQMTADAMKSRLFIESRDLYQKENVTYNHHQKCVNPEQLTHSYEDFFQVLSTSTDKKGVTYVSTIEAKNPLPVYGTQWHPEKNQFEWLINNKTSRAPHSVNAIKVGQYMSNFFVNFCRQRTRKALTLKGESDMLIYNYNPIFTGKLDNYEFEQIYCFESGQLS